MHHRSCQFGNFRWHGGREQNCLTLFGHLFYNRQNVFGKSHVEHTVGLVEHQVCGAAQVECAKLQVGNETARCGEHNVGSSLQRTALLFIAYAIVATIYGYGINSCVVGKALKCLVYLACQLARWGNDQAVYGVGRVGVALKQSEQRQQVGCRLARTRLGHAKHIVVLKNGRYTLCLYWCALFKPHVVECVEHVV